MSTIKYLLALLLLGATTVSPDVMAEQGPGGRPVGADFSRSPVYATHGMVSTAQPLASQVAIDVLKWGGSASMRPLLPMQQNVDLSQWPGGSAEVFHYMVEAKRLAFEDVARCYADPAFSAVPLQGLLSDAYGKQRFALINPEQARADFAVGNPKLEGECDTTYLTVADSSGMGSSLVPDGLGFMFHALRGQSKNSAESVL